MAMTDTRSIKGKIDAALRARQAAAPQGREALEPFLDYLKQLRANYLDLTPDTIIVGGPYNLTYAHFEKLAALALTLAVAPDGAEPCDTSDLWALVEQHGVDEVLEQVAMGYHDRAEEEENEEASRKWRVRGNGVMQALRFYQNFVKERDAT